MIIHYLQNYPIIQKQLNQILILFTKILNHPKLFQHLSIIFIFFFKTLMSYMHMDSFLMPLFLFCILHLKQQKSLSLKYLLYQHLPLKYWFQFSLHSLSIFYMHLHINHILFYLIQKLHMLLNSNYLYKVKEEFIIHQKILMLN